MIFSRHFHSPPSPIQILPHRKPQKIPTITVAIVLVYREDTHPAFMATLMQPYMQDAYK